jgi:hypothetical protein
MDFHSAMSFDEAAVTCDGASVYDVVSDSPGPDKYDRDELGVRGRHFMLSGVVASMMCDGFIDVFCCKLVPMMAIIWFIVLQVSCFHHLIG